jgi:hypothetical protein
VQRPGEPSGEQPRASSCTFGTGKSPRAEVEERAEVAAVVEVPWGRVVVVVEEGRGGGADLHPSVDRTRTTRR